MSSYLVSCLIITILSVFFGAIQLDKIEKEKKKKLEEAKLEDKKEIKKIYLRKKRFVLWSVILLNFLFLFIFKYLPFFTMNLNSLLKLIHINYEFKIIKLLSPIGISFYSLQAISYLIDVYNGKIEADYNLFRVALFISFFPGIIEGPIARYSDTAKDLYEGRPITYHNLCYGLQRILWGLFKKIVIADRVHILVKTIFNNYTLYSGPICFLGALGYTIMLYMEFSSTIDIVIGIGEIFDIKIPENFRQPFFSKSISEFWARWHISLGLWFKDYIYYPISLSKPLKKLTVSARKVVGNYFGPFISGTIALFTVWFLNGLWHGAGYTFLLFGMYHFLLITLGNLFEPLISKCCNKLRINRENIIYRVFRSLKVCFLVILGELIFRADTVSIAINMLRKIFTSFTFSTYEIASLGLDIPDYCILLIALLVVFIISMIKEKNISLRDKISNMPLIIRWFIYYCLIFSIIIFGAYGAGYQPVDPIYADF